MTISIKIKTGQIVMKKKKKKKKKKELMTKDNKNQKPRLNKKKLKKL